MREIMAAGATGIELDAAVVMPDHVHLVFRLQAGNGLSRVLKSIKGRSARNINMLLKREGHLWVEESFDHIVRHEEELEEKIEYIRQNAVKKKLVERPEDYRWLFLRV